MLHCFKTSVFISFRLGTTASDLLSHSSFSGYVPLFQTFRQFQAMSHCFRTFVTFVSFRLRPTVSDLLSHSSVSGYVPLFQTFCRIRQFQAMCHCFKPFVAFVSFRLCLTLSKTPVSFVSFRLCPHRGSAAECGGPGGREGKIRVQDQDPSAGREATQGAMEAQRRVP